MGVVIAIIVIVVIILIALGVWRYTQQRKVDSAAQKFGPEYDRTVEQYGGDKSKAASALQEKADALDEVTIHPLSADQRDEYAHRWKDVQAQFVDDPASAVTQADQLITEVMQTIGYPTDKFDNREDVVSVRYPGLAEDYRTAHEIAKRQQTSEDVSTEDLREAMLRYRSLFDQLVGVPQGDQAESPS